MSSKRPKLAYHQRTAASNNGEETSSVVQYEYTGRDHHVPNNVTHVRIHPSVIEIENFSFHNKLRLKEVVLNEGLTVIGSNAFSYCDSLQSITFPSTLNKIGASAFINCNSLRETVLNEGLKKIENDIFQRCTSLHSITLPSTITEIGYYAFANCRSLEEVVLNEGLKKIGRSAFKNCTELRSITIPSSVTCIEKETFSGCTNLREVKLSDGIWTIGDNVFDNCSLLDRLIFASTSNRLGNILSAGQTDIEAKIDVILNHVFPGVWRPFVRRGSELSISPEIQGLSLNWLTIKQCLNRIIGLITYYEVREATTMFELALWKARIDQTDKSIPSSERWAYRIEVPGPVKDAILQYL